VSKRLFDHDPVLGITKYWHYDAATDTARIESVQDVNPYLDANKAERNAHNGRFNDGMHKIASIPMTLYWQWKKEGLFEDENKAKLMMRLRDPSYSHLLTVQKI